MRLRITQTLLPQWLVFFATLCDPYLSRDPPVSTNLQHALRTRSVPDRQTRFAHPRGLSSEIYVIFLIYNVSMFVCALLGMVECFNLMWTGPYFFLPLPLHCGGRSVYVSDHRDITQLGLKLGGRWHGRTHPRQNKAKIWTKRSTRRPQTSLPK